jgi:hypothetical protein
MRSIAYLTFICIICFYFISCKKDKVNEQPQVYAGIVDSEMVYQKLEPSIEIKLDPDTLLNYSTDIDSVDLDKDGSFDLFISARQIYGPNDSLQNSFEDYPYCKMVLKNGFEIATITEHFPTGLGTTGSTEWVDTIHLNNPIGPDLQWSGTNTYRWMWVVPPTEFWGSYGVWYLLSDAELYVGLRLSEASVSKFGWLKIEQVSRVHLKLTEYAFAK